MMAGIEEDFGKKMFVIPKKKKRKKNKDNKTTYQRFCAVLLHKCQTTFKFSVLIVFKKLLNRFKH